MNPRPFRPFELAVRKRRYGAVSCVAVPMGTLLAVLVQGCSPPKPETTAIPPIAAAQSSADASAATDASDAADEPDVAPIADAAPRTVRVCELVTCSDHVELDVTLPIPASELASANVSLTIGEEAIPVRMPIPLDRTVGWGWQGKQHRNADVRVLRLSPVFSQLRIDVSFAEGITSGTAFSLKVETPTHGTVLDLTRTLDALPEPVHPAGPGCGEPCKYAAARLYAGSTTGRACGGQRCQPGLELHLHAPGITTRLNNATFHVCRNQDCAQLHLAGLFVGGLQNSAAFYNLHAGFEAPLFPSELVIDPRDTSAVVLYVTTDPVALVKGDRYTVTIREDGRELGKFETTVTSYDASYPNGPLCDLVPCLRKVLHANL